MQECSYCGRENDDASTNCRECGTSLAPEQTDVQRSQNSNIQSPRRAYGRKLVLRGAVCFGVGVVVTLFSHSSAVRSRFGGHYVVATGAMAVGIVQFFRGLVAASEDETNEQTPQDLLNLAARLESEDRAKAIALYAEIAEKFPGTRASDEALRNMQTLTAHREENSAS